MKIVIPKNRTEIKHFPKDLDLALVIFLTLLCIQTFLWERKLYQKKVLLEKFKDFLLAQVFFCKKKKCFGIRLSPILTVLSVFTISLAIAAYVRRSMIPEEDRFVVVIGRFIYDSHKYK